jgi:hypothetical protein
MRGRVDYKYIFLNEFDANLGNFDQAYFYQDLFIANRIFKNNPKKHIDIGSRIDGFVAHVASFRKIYIYDIRPIKINSCKNIQFEQIDFMSEKPFKENSVDSVSCLHAIEHFGLGRYGDIVDPNGHLKGFFNLVQLLELKGTLYISFPVGPQTLTYFNAHRIFHPLDILEWRGVDKLKLKKFSFIGNDKIIKNIDLKKFSMTNLYVGCGIYEFVKIKN